MNKYLFCLPLLLIPSVVLSDWGSGRCSPVGLPVLSAPLSQEHAYKWQASTRDPNQFHLLRDGIQIGTWFKKENVYWAFDSFKGKHSDSPSECPVDPPEKSPTKKLDPSCNCGPMCKCEPCNGTCVKSKIQNYGINQEQWKEEKEKNKYFSSASNIVDDSKFMRVVIVGQGRDQVTKDFENHPALLPFKGKILVSSYSADSFLIKDLGYVTTGSPTIYFMDPSGKVLHRQDNYKGAEEMAKALRKRDPNYDPTKDPDLNNSLIPSIDPKILDFAKAHWLKIVAGLGLAYFLFVKKK